MTKLETYNFKEQEKKWQSDWYQKSLYNFSQTNKAGNGATPFSIDTPPPTVSGQLHMGHIFSYTQTDFIARFKRMSGFNVFYPMGFDDNGLPTERLVEKLKNIKASQTDRAEFQKICHEVVQDEEEKFEDLFKSLGLSIDWNLKYQTISDSSATISQMSFLDLAEKNQVYRAEQPVLWDVVDRTALAQADIEDKEKNSQMHDVRFKAEDGSDLIIATTRPELLPACVAMFFHPEDSRYTHLANSYAISPIFGAKVPILPDPQVRQDKGTGLVMCCTFGDSTDISWWMTHKLPLKMMITKEGRISDSLEFELDSARQSFAGLVGLKVNEARAKMLDMLREAGDLIKSVDITQTVKCAERSGAPLEIITTPQWFIKTMDHKEALLQKSAELNWHPETMKIKLDTWINSISWDWCISRQRFFGIPIPVWYSKRAGEEGKIIFAKASQLPVDPIKDLPEGYASHEVEADLDVLDTWATSSVSPQLSTKAINGKYNISEDLHKQIFPFDLRPQAHEIIRTWAFYTILKSYLHEGSLPWKNIMVSGWCLASDKTKMSKSKGNAASPLKLIEDYGSDVIRHWASSSKLGQDTAFSEDLLKDGKRLVSKLWNASKFAAAHFDSVATHDASYIKNTMDIWLMTKLINTLDKVTKAYEEFEYAIAMRAIEEFFWKDFCDNYLEISKARCYNEGGHDLDGQISAITTLRISLKVILQMFAPVMPHITEEIYANLYGGESIHSSGNWPSLDDKLASTELEQIGDNLVTILELVRKSKASMNVSIKTPVEKLIIDSRLNLSDNAIKDLASVTNVTDPANISFSSDTENDPDLQKTENDEGSFIWIKMSQSRVI